MDHTGHCAATLHHVANEIPNPCLELVVRSDDESSDDESSYIGKRRTRKTKKKKKKKRSEAKAHSGILSDGISVTTDEKTEYSSSDDDSLTFVDDSKEQRRVATLQRRRAQFLRQRAIERTAEMDEDDEEEEAQYGRPKLTGGFKLTKKSAFPSQELRVQELRCDDDLEKVDISSLTDIRDLRDPSDKSFDSTKAAWSPELFEKDPFSSALDADTTAEDSLLLNSSNELELEILKPSPKWSSFSAEFPKLGDSTSHNLVLKESHLGATLANTPTTQSGLQLGDVIIRLNGQDVSTLDTSTVSDMINEMRDSRRITYLRKNVEL